MKHSHYFKDVARLQQVDIYRVLQLFDVADPCLQHAVKKLLVAGGRGVKDISRDVQEAIDTLQRWQEMQVEDRPSDRVIETTNAERAYTIVPGTIPGGADGGAVPRIIARELP